MRAVSNVRLGVGIGSIRWPRHPGEAVDRVVPYPMSSREESEHSKWFVDEVMPHEPILRAYLRKKFPQLAEGRCA